MRGFEIGSRVSLSREALNISYIKGRHFYTNMYEGKKGKVIGFTADNTKLAIEFDDIVFTRPDGRESSHDNGCHGRGKKHYCWYIPPEFVDLIEEDTNDDSDLLLLL